MGFLRAIWFWSTFPITTFIHYLILLVAVGYARIMAPERMSDYAHMVATWWGRSYFYLNPWWKFSVTGREHLDKLDGPAVIVANHQSGADIIAVYQLDMNFRWLAKEALFRVPCMGGAMRLAGYVPVRRGDPKSRRQAYIQSCDTLRGGRSMLYFPEGTRSETGLMRDFKPGAFRLALETRKPILPVALRGTREMIRKNSLIPGVANMTLEILPPIPVEENDDIPSLTSRVREAIAAALAVN